MGKCTYFWRRIGGNKIQGNFIEPKSGFYIYFIDYFTIIFPTIIDLFWEKTKVFLS